MNESYPPAQVDPTAIVQGNVTLADGVVIGPHCVIRGDVTLGPNTKLIGNVYLQGPITIGAHNTIYPFCALGLCGQDKSYDHNLPGAGTVIGDGNTLREYVTVHRATRDTPTQLGNDNYLMANAHVAHDCVVGNDCVLVNRVSLAGHCLIGDRVNMSGHSGTHQFVRVGRLSMVMGGAVMTKDLPPFCTLFFPSLTIGSLNVVGLRRAGLREHINPLRQAFRVLTDASHSNQVFAQRIRDAAGDDPLVQELAEFIETTQRGIFQFARKKPGQSHQ